MGQVAAALAAGNSVSPSRPSRRRWSPPAVELLHRGRRAGRRAAVCCRATAPGGGAALVRDPRIAGVAFTGSTEDGAIINRALADRPGPIVPLIAETGGQNAMIVDSSALPEQVDQRRHVSAFLRRPALLGAARPVRAEGYRRALLTMLAGAMDELVIGDPALLSTDIGPVIDADAKAMLDRHAERMRARGQGLIASRCKLAPGTEQRHLLRPDAPRDRRWRAWSARCSGRSCTSIRYDAGRLDQVLDAIAATGYGLTLGIHSRIDETIRHVSRRLRVGNAYVNRSMIGAVVGVQPFGGEGLSGTGPKAGGPRYLHRFATERVLSIDTTAAGGNASLLSLDEGA
jgi:RHH-type proline utilization regulon transcriptional repressor/proline dehydrogenase/delta 1-pyrroline-5-carboxylate dehydrogenase